MMAGSHRRETLILSGPNPLERKTRYSLNTTPDILE